MPDRGPKRYLTDLSHGCFTVGRIGRLQTLAAVPVVAGDSFELDLNCLMRTAPLRRYLTMDAIVDLCAFYVPHRHCYGDDWIDFVKQGYDESITFTGLSVAADEYAHCLTLPANGAAHTIFKALPYAYNSIWNRYYRIPVDNELDLDNDNVLKMICDVRRIPPNGQPPTLDTRTRTSTYLSGPHGDNEEYYDVERTTVTFDGTAARRHQLDFGYPCALPKRPWTTINRDVDDADREITVASNKFDILDISRARARYKSELVREWFTVRYNDILKGTYGAAVNIDADERPRLIARRTMTLSGFDVEGTDDATLGQTAGKAAGELRFGHRRTFFPEHGYYMVVALVRMPLAVFGETHPLHHTPNPSYLDISGDPELYRREPPRRWNARRWFGNSLSATAGEKAGFVEPYGQHYRYHPTFVHRRYGALQGFPFGNPATLEATDFSGMYYGDEKIARRSALHGDHFSGWDYNDIFQTNQLEHWQAQVNVGIRAFRVIPPAIASVMAGT